MIELIKRNKMRFSIAVIVVIISYLYFFAGKKEDPVDRKVQELSYYKPKYDDSISLEQKLQLMGLVDERKHTAAEVNDYLLFVYEEHGKTIHRPWGQYWAANKFESYCTKLIHDANPEGKIEKSAVVDCIYELARSTFPGHGDAIFSLYHKMQQYNNWMRQNTLTEDWKGKSPRDRAREIWEKRYELLGVEITEEIFEQRLTTKKTNDAVETAVAEQGTSIEQKIAALRKGMSATFGNDKADAILENERYYLASKFLKSPEVQLDLAKLDADDRKEALADIRRNLGFGEEEIARMSKRDRQQDLEWKRGGEYLKACEEYRKLYTGGELFSKIRDARTKFFGASKAVEIESEERRGVYRYKQQRAYGM